MECKHIDGLMMKYLDDALTEEESEILVAHIAVCPKCKADFEVYDEISAGLSDSPLYEAPEGFVVSVMAKLEDVDELSGVTAQNTDTAVFIIYGAISVLLGSGLLLAYNAESILNYMSGISFLSEYAETIRPFSTVVNGFLATLRDNAAAFATQAGAVLYDYRFAVIAVFAVSLISWYLVRRKGKVKAK